MRNVSVVATVMAVVALTGAAHANLLINPGFETGNFTGWDSGGYYIGTGGDARSGTYGAAYHVPAGRQAGDYYVMMQYVPVSAGVPYVGSTWLRIVGDENPNSRAWFEIVFHNNTGGWLSQHATTPVTNTQLYTQYTLNNLVAPGGAVTATIRAVVNTTGVTAGNKWYTWDDFSFAPIPEPTTLGLVGIGALLVSRMARSRNRV